MTSIAGAVVGIFLIFLLIIVLPFIILEIIGRWKLFKKAGKEGWEAIIPFYSDWVLVEIAGLDWYWFLFLISPSITVGIKNELSLSIGSPLFILANIAIFYNLSKKLKKDSSWIVLSVLFRPIMLFITGISNDVYHSDIEVSKNSFFDGISNNNTKK